MTGRTARWEAARTQPFDVIVVGGGITGAGVFRLAAQHGLRVLLLEQRDYAWGTSSRSGKLVHGGLRYLAQMQFGTSLRSVRERERLLAAYPGLVEPQDMLLVPPGSQRVSKWGVGAILAAYEGLAGRRDRRWLDRSAASARLPQLREVPRGAWVTRDAYTDDARLVWRILEEGRAAGGVALNYARVASVNRSRSGAVAGVVVEDAAPEGVGAVEVAAPVVVNATGAWSDSLRGGERRIRPLRGSHLLFRAEHLPLDCLVGMRSPVDGRALYVTPWEGRILLGTTDLDHEGDLGDEPRMTPAEGRYLLEALAAWFPGVRLGPGDVLSTMAGVRPVVGTGQADPSKESRDESIWADRGLVTVSGGKLTTFAYMAQQALRAAAAWLDTGSIGREAAPTLPNRELGPQERRLWGRYGQAAPSVAEGAMGPIADTTYDWAEVPRAASEEVVHLDDLLLRRLRLGLLLEDGGDAVLGAVRDAATEALGWSDARWAEELSRYRALWARAYGTAALDPSAPEPS